MKSGLGLVLLIAMGAAIAGSASFEAADWRWVHPSPQGAGLASVASDGSVYVAVGQGGMAVTGTSSQFLPIGTPVAETLNTVIWDGQRFVAVSAGREGQAESTPFLTSPDGLVWTAVDSGLNKVGMDGIAHNGSIYVVGARGELLYGPDLNSLQAGPAVASNITQVRWDGVQFVATGSAGGVYTTLDGTSVTPVDTGLTGTVWDSARDGDTWVVADLFHVATSLDGGTQWENTLSITGIRALHWDGDEFFVFLGNGTFYTSPDGVEWTEQGALSGPSSALGVNDMIAGPGGYLAVGNRGALFTSADGREWDLQTEIEFESAPRAIAWDGHRFVMPGASGAMISSTNRETWVVATPFDETMTYVGWLGSEFVAVGNNGAGGYSMSGSVWTPFATGVTAQLLGVATGGGIVVAVGAGGAIVSSPDLVTWDMETSGTTAALNAVVWTGQRFIAAGDDNTVLTSEDGATWTPRDSAIQPEFGQLEVAVSNGIVHLLAGDLSDGNIAYSTDGIAWEAVDAGAESAVVTGAWLDGFYVLGTFNTGFLISEDGRTWTAVRNTRSLRSGAVAGDDNGYVHGALGSAILTTAPPLSLIFTDGFE